MPSPLAPSSIVFEMNATWLCQRPQWIRSWVCLLLMSAALGCSGTSTKTIETPADIGASESSQLRTADDTGEEHAADSGPRFGDNDMAEGRGEDQANREDSNIGTELGLRPSATAPEVVVGTWNLHNFSEYGLEEFRIIDIADQLTDLDADIVGVQELKIDKDKPETDPQAWDGLLAELPDMEGLHNPWNSFDSVVGFLYRPETTTVLASKALFVGDWWPFPRAPIEATLRVQKGQEQVTFRVIVVHLKAFPDALDRRIEACTKLDTYIQSQVGMPYLVLGDFNDDPRDAPEANAFMSSFLADGSNYAFVTLALPEHAVTSLGYYDTNSADQTSGEFLDHFVANSSLTGLFSDLLPSVKSYPFEDYGWYERSYSDHFPVVVVLNP